MHKIADIKNYPPGSQIDQVQGRISKVFDARTGTKNGNPWRLQNFVLQDGQGNEIKATAFGHPELGIYQGKDVVIAQGANHKGQPDGIEVKLNDYNGKKTNELVISKYGTFQFIQFGGSTPVAPKPSDNDSVIPVTVKDYPIKAQEQAAAGRAALNDIGALYVACAEVAVAVQANLKGKGLEVINDLQTLSTSLHIEANKKGIRIPADTPSSPVVTTKEQVAYDKLANTTQKPGHAPVVDDDSTVPF